MKCPSPSPDTVGYDSMHRDTILTTGDCWSNQRAPFPGTTDCLMPQHNDTPIADSPECSTLFNYTKYFMWANER